MELGIRYLPRVQAVDSLRPYPRSRTIRVACTTSKVEQGRLSERVGVVIVDHGSRKKDSNDMLHEVCDELNGHGMKGCKPMGTFM